MLSLLLNFFILLLSFTNIYSKDPLSKPIKIVDGAPLTSSTPGSSSSSDSNTVISFPPRPFNGPSSLLFLSKICIPFSYERFEYTLCPFQNITQKRTIGNSIINLGSWGDWVTENKKEDGSSVRTFSPVPISNLEYFKLQKYTNGKSCGENDEKIESTIEFVCEYPTSKGLEVISLDDSYCKFNFKLGVNAPCSLFKNHDII